MIFRDVEMKKYLALTCIHIDITSVLEFGMSVVCSINKRTVVND